MIWINATNAAQPFRKVWKLARASGAMVSAQTVRAKVSNIEQTDLLIAFSLTPGPGRTESEYGGAMQDRDSFYHRAIRTRLGEALKALTKPLLALDQRQSVAGAGKEPKGLDLDKPEQRRRFMEGVP
jgi:hypothetical protein